MSQSRSGNKPRKKVGKVYSKNRTKNKSCSLMLPPQLNIAVSSRIAGLASLLSCNCTLLKPSEAIHISILARLELESLELQAWAFNASCLLVQLLYMKPRGQASNKDTASASCGLSVRRWQGIELLLDTIV